MLKPDCLKGFVDVGRRAGYPWHAADAAEQFAIEARARFVRIAGGTSMRAQTPERRRLSEKMATKENS